MMAPRPLSEQRGEGRGLSPLGVPAPTEVLSPFYHLPSKLWASTGLVIGVHSGPEAGLT